MQMNSFISQKSQNRLRNVEAEKVVILMKKYSDTKRMISVNKDQAQKSGPDPIS